MAPWAWLKFWKWFTNAKGDAKRAFRGNVVMNQATLDNMALAYHAIQLNQPALAKQVAQSLGVNKFAMPNVGEAYETYRVGVGMPPLQDEVAGTTHWVRHNWGQHIGGVVAASGNDRVTLENYARKHEIDNMRTGADYYFQMYGSRKHQDVALGLDRGRARHRVAAGRADAGGGAHHGGTARLAGVPPLRLRIP